MQINGLDQLDGGGDPLQLIVVRLEDTGIDAEGSITAARLIQRLRVHLDQAPNALQAFETLLQFAGWDDDIEQEPVSVRPTRIDKYEVDQDFPRLTGATVPAAVVEATYKIVLPSPQGLP